MILGLQFGSPTSAAESQLNHTRDGVPIPDDSRRKRLVARLDDVGSASSCTCLPGTSISYLPAGIVITRPSGVGGLGAEWISPWSQPLLSIAEGPMPDLLEALGREIHRDVVSEEVDRICGSLYIDGGQAWSVANAGGTRIGGGGGGDAGGGDAGGNAPFATRRQSPEPIKFTLSYLDFN